MNTSTTIISIAVLALFMGNASAQVVKCKDSNGKTVYSDTACPDGEKVINTTPSAPKAQVRAEGEAPQITSPAGSQSERELRAKISGLLIKKDYDGAAALAVTEEHFNMVSAAKRADTEGGTSARNAKAKAEPMVTCTPPSGKNFALSSFDNPNGKYDPRAAAIERCKGQPRKIGSALP